MIGKWLKLLQPAPYATPIQDHDEIQSSYQYWRIRIVYSLFIGYAVFYFTRKSFTFAAPMMMEELHLGKGDIGLLGTILYISYGISKFLSGVLSDRSNPRFFMAYGLIITGFCNILFGFSSSMWLFAIFWGLNGWFQAWGWPACCKSLTYWFKKSERGLWYGFTSTSHNVGGALIPIIVVFCAMQFGWRYAFFIPAIISIIMGFILMNRLRDIPESLGLPPVEARHEKVKDRIFERTTLLSVKEIMFKQVLNNKFVWIFAISYFFVYVVRTVVNDWGAMYLIEVKDFSKMSASLAVSAFETGGFFGMLIAGWGSDYFFKGNRVPTIVICAIGLIFSIAGLWSTPINHQMWDILFFAMIGFFVFGPQMIVGLAAAEFVDKRAAAASNGFTGTLGYFGAACACYPIGIAIDKISWSVFYITLLAGSFFIFALLYPLWSQDKSSRRIRAVQNKPIAENT